MKKFSERTNQLLSLADKTLATKTQSTMGMSFVNGEYFTEFRSSALSLIKNIYGDKHPYYTEFDNRLKQASPSCIEYGKGILKAIKTELDEGWIITMKGIVSAEIFSNFLDMADHLLNENYKAPAAVMIGSVLEEHLRQLCYKQGILIIDSNSGKNSYKKADLLNAELAGAGVYNKLDQKNVTAWLDLRNKSAHGKYNEYNQQQVEFMLQAVTEFMARIKV